MAVTSVAVIAAVALVLVPSAKAPRHEDANRPHTAVVHLTAAHTAVSPVTAAAERAAGVAEVQFSTSVLRAAESGNALHNAAIDPFSLSRLLTEAELGARGTTAAALHQLLARAGTPLESQAAALGALGRSAAADAARGGVRWASSNELLVSQSRPVSDAYLNELARTLGTGVWWSDFAHGATSVADAVNRWGAAAGATANLVSPAEIGASTGLVGLSADRFSGAFDNASTFALDNTHPGYFTLADGSTVPCQLMHNESGLGYADQGGAVAVQLKFVGGQLSADVIMPTKGSLDSYLHSLTGARLSALLGALRPNIVKITLPLFSVSSSGDQTTLLRSLGLGAATGGRADFAGISPSVGAGGLRLSRIAANVDLSVNQSGVNAAARSAQLPAKAYAHIVPAQFTHPFIFIIRDGSTGAILFESVVVDPVAR